MSHGDRKADLAYQEQDYLRREDDYYSATKYAIILRWLGAHPGRRVLNVGCGSGEVNLLLAERKYVVDAIDLSPTAVALAERRLRERGLPGVTIWRSDLFELAPGPRYHAVVCLDVLEHIEDDRRAVEQIEHLLLPGGVLLVAVPALQALYGYHDEQLGHHRRYSRAQLLRLLSGRLAVTRCRYVGLSLIPVVAWYSRLRRVPYPAPKPGSRVGPAVLRLESRVRVPLGISLLAMAEKVAP